MVERVMFFLVKRPLFPHLWAIDTFRLEALEQTLGSYCGRISGVENPSGVWGFIRSAANFRSDPGRIRCRISGDQVPQEKYSGRFGCDAKHLTNSQSDFTLRLLSSGDSRCVESAVVPHSDPHGPLRNPPSVQRLASKGASLCRRPRRENRWTISTQRYSKQRLSPNKRAGHESKCLYIPSSFFKILLCHSLNSKGEISEFFAPNPIAIFRSKRPVSLRGLFLGPNSSPNESRVAQTLSSSPSGVVGIRYPVVGPGLAWRLSLGSTKPRKLSSRKAGNREMQVGG